MTKAPEQIWIQTDHIPDHVALDQIDEKPDTDEAHRFTSYTRTDVAQAQVAAAYLDAANLHQSLWRETNAYKTDQIIKRIPTDAKAALDRIVAEAGKEADTPETAAQQLLMVENIDTIADACRQFRVPQEKFRAILSALKGGEA